MKKIKSVYLNGWGQVVCSDLQGQQIGELQKSFPILFAEEAVRNGYDPEGVVIETPYGPARIFGCYDYDDPTKFECWNWETL